MMHHNIYQGVSLGDVSSGTDACWFQGNLHLAMHVSHFAGSIYHHFADAHRAGHKCKLHFFMFLDSRHYFSTLVGRKVPEKFRGREGTEGYSSILLDIPMAGVTFATFYVQLIWRYR